MKWVTTGWIGLTFLLGLNGPASAAPVPVYQLGETKGAYVHVELSHDIYRYSASEQLADLLVLDRDGNKLPYRLTLPSSPRGADVKEVSARFFPVPVGATSETLLVLSSASIRLSDNEISVTVEKDNRPPTEERNIPTDFYVVDLSELGTGVDELLIDWTANPAHSFIEVDVSGSNDLTSWTPLKKATLVHLQKEGEQLLRNRIALGLKQAEYAYLRVKLQNPGERAEVNAIRITSLHPQPHSPVIDSWQLQGRRADSQVSVLSRSAGAPVSAWEFTREDIAPLERMSINLGQSSYGDTLRVFSRTNPRQPWQLIHQGIWFNTKVGSEWQHSDPLAVAQNSHTHWRIELNAGFSETAAPSLVFYHQPSRLQSILNDNPPYQLAIDTSALTSQPVENHRAVSEAIFSQLVDTKNVQWETASLDALHPDLGQFARHGINISWKTLLFWCLLIAAVGLLLGVALRLLRQMKA